MSGDTALCVRVPDMSMEATTKILIPFFILSEVSEGKF